MSRAGQTGDSTTLSRYDATLLAIPGVFLGTIATAIAIDVDPLLGLGSAALVSGLLMVDSLFLNPPAEIDSP
jgi:hypothetical protein